MSHSSTSNSKVVTGTAPDGLIDVPEHTPAYPAPAWLTAFVLLTSLVVIVATAAIDLAFPIDAPTLIGKEKVDNDAMQANAKWSDGSMARLIEHNHRVTSRVRKSIGRKYASFLFHRLGETPKGVVSGSDGWLFLERRIAHNRGNPELGGRVTALAHAAASRRLAPHGMRYILVPLPRKSVVFEDKLPWGLTSMREIDDVIIRSAQQYGVEAVDLLPAWDAWEGEPVYQRTDTHWSANGIRLAAEEIARQTGLLVPESERRGEIRPGGRKHAPGSIYRIMDIAPESSQSKYWENNAIRAYQGKVNMRMGDLSSPGVICGTSFTQFADFYMFLTHYTNKSIGNYDTPGGSSYISLMRMLKERKDSGFPQFIVVETPNHLVTNSFAAKISSLNQDVGEVFSFLPLKESLPLALPPNSWNIRSKGKPVKLTSGGHAAVLKEGLLVHDGSGTVELQADIEILSGTAKIRVDCKEPGLTAILTKGRHTVSLPILCPHSTSSKVVVVMLAQPNGKEMEYVLHEVSAVVGGNSFHPVPFNGPNQSDVNTLQFSGSHPIERHTAVIVEVKDGIEPLKDVHLNLASADGTKQQEFRFPLIKPGARIVVSPGHLIGGSLRTLSTNSETSWIKAVRLLPL